MSFSPSLQIEEWRSVPNTYVEVSNLGNLRHKRGKQPWDKSSKKEYVYHGTSSVHRFVLEAFIGPCPPGHECNHKNGVKNDNRLENLEWVTKSENTKHSYRVLYPPEMFHHHDGDNNPNSSISEEAVLQIREMAAKGYPQWVMEIKFKMSQSQISAIILRKSWRHI